MRRILITGGAGFIGSNLALRLLKSGYEVTVLDNLSRQIHGPDPESSSLLRAIIDKVRFIRGDVTRADELKGAIAGQDAIVHLAAETGTGQSMYQVDHYTRVNVGGTALLLDLVANSERSIKRIVVASSRAVYGEGKYLSKELGVVYPSPRSLADMQAGNFEIQYPGSSALTLTATDESSRIHPSSVYGITKQTQEQLVMTVCPGMGIQPVALRYQNVYGPGQSLSNPYTGILSIFSNLIMAGKPLNIFEDGRESRDFVFIDDVVEATVLALEREGAGNQVFNVGTGVPTSVATVAAMLQQKLNGNSSTTISGNFRLGDIRHNYADLSKARRLLGFEPRVDFDAGLTRFCAWAKTMGARDNGYEASLQEMKARGLMK